MDTLWTLEKYAKYYKSLITLGNFPIWESPTIDEAGLTRAVIQAGYRDMRDLRFDGNLVEFLCFVSTQRILMDFLQDTTNKPVVAFLTACGKSIPDTKNMLRLFGKDPRYLIYKVPESSQKEIFDAVNELRWREVSPTKKDEENQ